MRERMERFVLLPFSVGCISESSVAVGDPQPRKSKPNTNPSPIRPKEVEEDDDDEESMSGESIKSSFRSLSLRKPNVSTGINRLFKGFKTFSQYFAYKEEMQKMDMEIGGPTDVKHVTHIGWDGSASINDAVMGWENLISPDLLSVPSDPWRQSFDFSMAAQPDQPSLVNGSALI